MATLTIEIADKDRDLLEQLAQRLNGKVIKVVEDNAGPNSLTKKAIADARSGKTKKIADIDLFFKSL